ncbi:MAG: U32 family peptidase, partial [Candidatus ainarchaeum sp.]|nr:U32 family peptidase [Candidatus ainarchaeum sp.]
MNKPELLMPAGNLEKLKIAVTNGADAVYFGAQKFNMRTGADNFSNQDIKEGITFCHFYNKKAYLTLNTSLKDSEIEDALEVAKFAFESGIDALIVQDIGLIKLLRELLPDLELHASTQMTCNNIQGAEFLANFGFKKIVLARELNLLEIKEISDFLHSKNVEVEVFTHGAECFSYSGQCLFSSFVFNKSGNRGRCMQPCRLVYSKVDSNDKARFLSMKDLCT